MRITAAIFCCLGLFAGLAACTVVPKFTPRTSVTTPAVGHPPPPASVEAAISSEAFTPYAELGHSSGDGLAPSQSLTDLSKVCLTDAGYPNATGPPSFAAFGFGSLTTSQAWGAWGYLGVAQAAQDGFSLTLGYFNEVIPQSSAGGTSSAAEQKAANKCQGIVGKFSNTQTSGALAGIQTLSNDIQTDVQRDPSVKAATRAWSACMKQNGYTLTDPQTAFIKAVQGDGALVWYSGSGGFQSQAGSAPGSSQAKAQKQAQIALAVTDADCTQSTDLAGIYFAVRASYEQQITDLNQQALTAAVIEYRNAYQKELSKLPQLLK
jgi:hypothetical protein